MEPNDFKSLAEELARRKTPANLRTAISRAYYYAFLSGRKFVGRYLFVPSNHQGHAHLTQLLYASRDDELIDVARQIGDLRSYRNEADYQLDKLRPEKESHVSFCVETAATSVQGLVKVMADAPRWNKIVDVLKKDPTYAPKN
jgi:uncharacterized protein (UPF0332 family)